jgi:hypothetical protein
MRNLALAHKFYARCTAKRQAYSHKTLFLLYGRSEWSLKVESCRTNKRKCAQEALHHAVADSPQIAVTNHFFAQKDVLHIVVRVFKSLL